MLHGIKCDNGDGSTTLLFFSTQALALQYATHSQNEDRCRDGDGVTYFVVNATPNHGFQFDDELVGELDQ